MAWWRGLVKWSDAEHLRLPLVNTTSDIQKHLARAVAEYVAARTQKEGGRGTMEEASTTTP